MRCQFAGLFKCEKTPKFHVSICVCNLPIFVATIFVTLACHFEYRLNWHAKSLQSKSIAEIGTLNLQKEAMSKFCTLPNVDLMTTTRHALRTQSAWVSICFCGHKLNLQIFTLPFFCRFNVPIFAMLLLCRLLARQFTRYSKWLAKVTKTIATKIGKLNMQIDTWNLCFFSHANKFTNRPLITQKNDLHILLYTWRPISLLFILAGPIWLYFRTI